MESAWSPELSAFADDGDALIPAGKVAKVAGLARFSLVAPGKLSATRA